MERCREHSGGGVKKTIVKDKMMPNQKRFLGRFFYKLTDNGNLVGEFSNNVDADIVSESADWKCACEDNCPNCLYHGTYLSTWRHDNGAVIAELKISRKKGIDASDKLFSLEWRKDNKTLIFKGEGMLCDGILIGNYYEPGGDEIASTT